MSVDPGQLLLKARRGCGLSQRRLSELAGTSQATLSTYERGVKSPSLAVAERIVEAAGYRLDLVTQIQFTQHTDPVGGTFWVPNRLWRGRLPECFAKIYLEDATRFRGITRFDLRRRAQRRRLYELVLRRGQPDELIDWVDGALLVDLWEDLQLPALIRRAWQPVVELASDGPRERPRYGRTE